MTDYQQLQKELAALIEGVPYPIANLANASALIFQMMKRFELVMILLFLFQMHSHLHSHRQFLQPPTKTE